MNYQPSYISVGSSARKFWTGKQKFKLCWPWKSCWLVVETGRVDSVAEGRVCGGGAETCLEKVRLSKRGYIHRESNDLQQPKARSKAGFSNDMCAEPQHKRKWQVVYVSALCNPQRSTRDRLDPAPLCSQLHNAETYATSSFHIKSATHAWDVAMLAESFARHALWFWILSTISTGNSCTCL